VALGLMEAQGIDLPQSPTPDGRVLSVTGMIATRTLLALRGEAGLAASY